MFHTGDMVLYGSNGVCEVTGTDMQEFDGDMIEYLVLKPVYDKTSTLFVPSKNQMLMAKIHPVLSENQVYDFISSIPSENTVWIDDEKQRKQVYQNMIAGGDRKHLVQIIKTLYLHKLSQNQLGRKLHQSDEKFFRQAEKLLYDEFAAVLHISPDEVSALIARTIETQQTGTL